MRRARTWARWLAFAAALLLAPDCTGPSESTGDGGDGGGEGASTTSEAAAAEDGVRVAAAIWTLDWDTEGVVFPAGGGAEIETDLGYRVHVEQGRILSHSVSFGPCDSASPAPASSSSGQAVFGLPIRTARAHTENTDPSTIETSLIEDLTAPHATDADTSFAAARYCRVHWLLARPTNPTAGPDDVTMANRSLFVTGTFERGGVVREFIIDTWWPEGKLIDLDEAMESAAFEAARADGEARHAFVTVTRHLGSLFDGIDFEVASDDQIAGRAIDNLVGGTTFEVELWAPGEEGAGAH